MPVGRAGPAAVLPRSRCERSGSTGQRGYPGDLPSAARPLQRDALLAAGVDVRHLFEDHSSGANDDRPGLAKALTFVQPGDVLVVWKLDRFARSLKQLVNALAEMEALGIAFVSLRDNLDLSTPSGRLMFQIIGAMAEFERALIQERVRAGLRHARTQGKRLGRPGVIVEAKRIRELRAQGASLRTISRQLGVGLGTVHRALPGRSKTGSRTPVGSDSTVVRQFDGPGESLPVT